MRFKETVVENGIEYEIEYETLPNNCGSSVKFPISKREVKRVDFYKIAFPFDPIQQWAEKKIEEINKKFKWIDEVEWR